MSTFLAVGDDSAALDAVRQLYAQMQSTIGASLPPRDPVLAVVVDAKAVRQLMAAA
jgi:hypothetical protein